MRSGQLRITDVEDLVIYLHLILGYIECDAMRSGQMRITDVEIAQEQTSVGNNECSSEIEYVMTSAAREKAVDMHNYYRSLLANGQVENGHFGMFPTSGSLRKL
ncbi:unnamed protein product, partial [Strongylus vulgaris]